MTNSPPPALPEDDFWRFSLDFYRHPSVAKACLELQDNHGADVNLLLYCCWAARRYAYRLDDAELATLTEAVADWQTTVIRPLRGVRRRLKMPPAALPAAAADHVRRLRQAVQQSELDAERQAQRLLVAAFLPPGGAATRSSAASTAAAARDSCLRYLRRLGVDAVTNARAHGSLATLLAVGFDKE